MTLKNQIKKLVAIVCDLTIWTENKWYNFLSTDCVLIWMQYFALFQSDNNVMNKPWRNFRKGNSFVPFLYNFKCMWLWSMMILSQFLYYGEIRAIMASRACDMNVIYFKISMKFYNLGFRIMNFVFLWMNQSRIRFTNSIETLIFG